MRSSAGTTRSGRGRMSCWIRRREPRLRAWMNFSPRYRRRADPSHHGAGQRRGRCVVPPARWKTCRFNNNTGSGAGSLDETDDPGPGPAGDAFARGIVLAVDDAVFGHIDPGVGRILPAGEFLADEGLKMTVDDAVAHGPAVGSVAAGQVGLRLAKALVPGGQIRVCARRRGSLRRQWVTVEQTGRGECWNQPSWHPMYPLACYTPWSRW